MNELEELRKRIEEQDYIAALQIVDELEEMSREDKLNKIYSYIVILLLHRIKQVAEGRTTSSWNRSIDHSVNRINRINKRRKSGGYYADRQLMSEIIDEAYSEALKEASYEAFEGKLTIEQLSKKVSEQNVKESAIVLLECN